MIFRGYTQDCVPEDRLWMVTFTDMATERRCVEWCTGPEDAYAMKKQVLAQPDICIDVNLAQYLPPEQLTWRKQARMAVFDRVVQSRKGVTSAPRMHRVSGGALPELVMQRSFDRLAVVSFPDTRGNTVEILASSDGEAWPLLYPGQHAQAVRSAWGVTVFRECYRLEMERYAP